MTDDTGRYPLRLKTHLGLCQYAPIVVGTQQQSISAAMENSKCVVLVPVGSSIEPDCETGLRGLEARGYVVRRVYGYAAIDQARSRMATDALGDGFEELMWIDSDVAFDADDVDKLRRHALPVVCGIYPKKGQGRRALSCQVAPGTQRLTFGQQGGLTKIQYAATGFLLTKRRVYSDIRRKFDLPDCNRRFGRAMVPYFLPLIVADGEHGHWYLGEDFAFCERARQAGNEIVADTSIRLRHIGRYGYSFEDAGGELKRFTTYNLNMGPQSGPSGTNQ
jgi:hypothetical protein